MLIVEIFSLRNKEIVNLVPGEGWAIKSFYILFFVLIGADLWLKFFEDPSIRFARIYGENKDFLSRLSTLERKRWIVQEMFNRKEYNLRLTEDVTLTFLKTGKGKDLNSQIEPCNFSILSNETYHRKMLFTPIHRIEERE